MRLRIGVLALVALALSAVGGGCKFYGVSAVYMALDQQGQQPRTVFYTDSTAIYCVALVSAGSPDTTVDFTIYQTGSTDPKTGIVGPTLHQIFAVDEETPGTGTETPVGYNVPPNGVEIMVNCLGYCLQNGIGCPPGYTNEGNDTCGIGAACCFNPTAPAGMTPSVLPYPAGTYKCGVQINGTDEGSTDFTVEFPPSIPAGCNPATDSSCETCPVPPPANDIVCIGWVPEGARCTGFNSTQTCTCTGATWSCK